MFDVFHVVEHTQLTAQKDLVSCNFKCIERPETKVVILGPSLFIFDGGFKLIDSYKHNTLFIWRDLNASQLHSELVKRNYEELKSHFKSFECIPVVGKTFLCYDLTLNTIWSLQLRGRWFVTAHAKECRSPFAQCLIDPFSVVENGISLQKVSLICETIYAVALSCSGQLFLFNLFAGVCLGPITKYSKISDFCIYPLTSQTVVNPDSEYPGLYRIIIFILRDLEENDQPSSTGPTKILEVIFFPRYRVIHRMHVAKESWLLSDFVVSDYQPTETTLNGARVLFGELHSDDSDDMTKDCLLSIKTLKETNPKEKLECLLELENFDEAKLLVKTFNLGSVDFQRVVLMELRFLVNAILKQKKDNDVLCVRLLVCLHQIEELWRNLELVESILQITMPDSEGQMKLLLVLKRKLTVDNSEDISNDHENIGTKILVMLKRLKAFLLVHGSNSYTPEVWIEFRDANIYFIFAGLFVSNLVSPEEASWDPSRAFLFWTLYKGELSEYLTPKTLEKLCDLLSKRPLTYNLSKHSPSELTDDKDTSRQYSSEERELVEYSPCSLQLLTKFLTGRVKQLETCSSPSNSTSYERKKNVRCPFSWPSSAISWVNQFLESVNISESNCEKCSSNIYTVTDFYLSGLASRNPDVDPFYELRKLAKQLETIKVLGDIYNYHLSIDCCEGETKLSSRLYREDGIDKLMKQYLKDWNIDHQTFFQGYSSDLIDRIRAATTSFTSVNSCADDSRIKFVTEQPVKKSSSTLNHQVLVKRACLIANWITVPACRMKVVLDLASVAPLPWPDSLLILAETVLKQTRIQGSCSKYVDGLVQKMNELERLCNKARLDVIFTRYKINEFTVDDIGTSCRLSLGHQAVSRILLSTAGPFGESVSFCALELTSGDTVYRDAVTVAQKLFNQTTWPWLFAQLYMRLTLFKTMEQKKLENTVCPDEYENRISFFIAHLNFCATEILSELFNPTHEINNSTSQFVFIRNWLIHLTFRSFKQILAKGNVLFSFQRCLIVDIGLSMASMIRTLNPSGTEKISTPVNWSSIMKFAKLYFTPSTLDEAEASVILQLFSDDTFLPALLSNRLLVVRRLTKLCVEQLHSTHESTNMNNFFSIPSRLCATYTCLLSDIPSGIRKELLIWEWFSSLCCTICSPIASSESCSTSNLLNVQDSLVSRALLIQSVLAEMAKLLTHVKEICVYRILGKGKREVEGFSSTYICFVPTCSYCNFIWNHPLARLGCIIKLFIQFILPFLLKTVKSVPFTEASSRKSIISTFRTVLSTFLSLLQWSGAQDYANPIAERKCNCHMLALTSDFQNLRQIVQTFFNVFDQIDHAFQELEVCHKDPLEYVFYASMYREQTTVDVAHPELLSSHFVSSLEWLISLLKWFTFRNSYKRDSKIDDAERKEFGKNDIGVNQLLKGGMEIASSWSFELGMSLTGAHILLLNTVNLISSRVTQSIWSDSYIVTVVNDELRDDLIVGCFNLCTKYLSCGLNSVLNPSHGKYLDQPLALSLSLALPIEEATYLVRNVVAQSKHAPKKIMAVAGIIYMFSQITLKRELGLLELSQNMAKMWSWHIALKPHKLNFSRIVANGMDTSSLEHILDKLCRMVPSLKGASAHLLPSGPQHESMPIKLNSCVERSLPPLKLIARFSEDFNLPLKPYLLKHLNALFQPCNSSIRMSAAPDFKFALGGSSGSMFFNSNNNDKRFTTSTNITNSSEVHHYLRCQKICLSRAHAILRFLFREAMRTNNPQLSITELANIMQSFYVNTSPYDYERISFLLSWIYTCCPKMITNKEIQLLSYLRTYKRSFPPREYECVSPAIGNEGFMLSKFIDQHQLCNIRMPYHQLFSDSFPIRIAEPEITLSSVEFWLRLDQCMGWGSSDVIKITAAENLVNRYVTVGLLPVTNSNNLYDELTVPMSVGWDRALPCQIIVEPLFHQLHSILQSVTFTPPVYSLLSGLARRVIYGPHRLLVLKLACDLAKTYLLRMENEARIVHKQFAIEGFLYEHHLADWKAINKNFNSPFELILALLSASTTLSAVTDDLKLELPLSNFFIKQRVSKVIPYIAELANINLPDVAKHILVSRLKIPFHIFSNHQDSSESPTTNRSFSLDMTFESSELSSNDITFNATMCEPKFGHAVLSVDDQKFEQSEPEGKDFMLAELLLQQEEIKRQLLPTLDFFVFMGASNQYISAKWRAVRCILRCQRGTSLRPKLSFSELRSTLLRLSVLATCPNSTYQQFIFDAFSSCTSVGGDTFNSLCYSHLTDSIKQLLMTSNSLTAIHFASHLILDYEILSPPILTQLLESIYRSPEVEALDYALRLLIFVQSSTNFDQSMKWFFLNPIKEDSILYNLLSSLIQRLFLMIVPTKKPDSKRVHNLNKLLYFMISSPFSDTEIETIFVQFRKSLSLVFSQQSIRVSDSLQKMPSIFAVYLHLLASSFSTKRLQIYLNAWYNSAIEQDNEHSIKNVMRDAIQNSELCLTAKFLGLS
ncbi:unnamed protein product [Heterobilharzia americana]|nr:unnamed protein product [Heterobilharzia americana]